MTLKFCSFASSSSGNSYLVESENTKLLVDVGIAGKKILGGLRENHIEPEEINGILITHEHIDHVKSVRMLSRKAVNAKVYATQGTASQISDKVEEEKLHIIDTEYPFTIGDIMVKPFNLSHDAAEPVGYVLEHNGKKISIITDTGYISEEIFRETYDSDFFVLEANHEINILKMGSYPYRLKQRILGNFGHLSNEAAGAYICRIIRKRKKDTMPPKIVLAHLSSENNTPSQAYLTIRNILFEEDLMIGRDLELGVILKDEMSSLMEV